MSVFSVLVDCLLAGVVLTCWTGAAGMVRMREPMQALHYLSVPATLGAALMTLAVWMERGLRQTSFKVTAIAFLLIATNAIVTHATARMFRVRDAGDWRSHEGIPVERVEQQP